MIRKRSFFERLTGAVPEEEKEPVRKLVQRKNGKELKSEAEKIRQLKQLMMWLVERIKGADSSMKRTMNVLDRI